MDPLTAGAELRIVLADDHAMLRSALRRYLAPHGFVVVGEAANGEEAVALVSELEPDLALLDIAMRPMDGLEAARRIASMERGSAVVMLTACDEIAMQERAREAGADGFVSKTAPIDVLMRALTDASTARGPRARRWKQKEGVAALSAREVEVLSLIAEGYRRIEIGAILTISPRTVDAHRASILRKLGVTSIAEAARTAERAGIVRRPL